MTIRILFVLVLGLSQSLMAQQHEVTIDNYLSSAKQLKEVRADDVDAGYEMLERLVASKPKVDAVLMKKIMDVHLFLLQNDKSNYGPELLAPIFGPNKKLYDDVVKTYPVKDKDLIEYRQKIYERLMREGNG